MSNLTITNNDSAELVLGEDFYQDDIFTSAGADELAKGTILARDSVSGKLVLFVKGGATNENGIPKTVLPYDLSIAGAGDVSVRILTAGRVRKDQLVIDADGDDSNVDKVVRDQLRDYGIVTEDVNEMNFQDNQ